MMLKRKVPPPSDNDAIVEDGTVVNDEEDIEQPIVTLDVSDTDLSESSINSAPSNNDDGHHNLVGAD